MELQLYTTFSCLCMSICLSVDQTVNFLRTHRLNFAQVVSFLQFYKYYSTDFICVNSEFIAMRLLLLLLYT